MNANYLLKVLTLVLGACLPLLLSQLSYSQESLQASFKSWNYRDYYIRHKNFAVFLERIVDQQGRNDASFIFVPGLAGLALIADLTKASPLPVNIMVSQGADITALAKRGVARVSFGADSYVVTMNALQEAARKAMPK